MLTINNYENHIRHINKQLNVYFSKERLCGQSLCLPTKNSYQYPQTADGSGHHINFHNNGHALAIYVDMTIIMIITYQDVYYEFIQRLPVVSGDVKRYRGL